MKLYFLGIRSPLRLPSGVGMRERERETEREREKAKNTLFNVRFMSGPVSSRRVWVDATSTSASHGYCVWYLGLRLR